VLSRVKGVAVLSEKHQAEIANMTDKELAAVWNILSFPGMTVSDDATRAHDAAVKAAVSAQMEARTGFRPSPGSLIATIPNL
jgi:hypothetical protein